MGRACTTHGKLRVACKILLGKLKQKRLLGRLWCKWEDSINNYDEIGYEV
jgi:hypothetical protein